MPSPHRPPVRLGLQPMAVGGRRCARRHPGVKREGWTGCAEQNPSPSHPRGPL